MDYGEFVAKKKPDDGWFSQNDKTISAVYVVDVLPPKIDQNLGGALIKNSVSPQGRIEFTYPAPGKAMLWMSANQAEFAPIDEFNCTVRLMGDVGKSEYVLQDVSFHFIKKPEE
jgi:hypothetical protein